MSGITNIAVNGLNNAGQRAFVAANNIVNASSTPTPQSIADPSTRDVATNIVNLNEAGLSYSANALVIKTAQKLDKALIDIKT
jgi:flagellar basal body rod protein FlgC